MSNYSINIHYKTGDSFGSSEESEEIGSFETLEDAKEFLKFLKEHHKFVTELNKLRSLESINKFKNKYNKEPWYYLKAPEYSFNYKERNYSAFYIGYFETLLQATIVVLNKNIESDWYYTPDTY